MTTENTPRILELRRGLTVLAMKYNVPVARIETTDDDAPARRAERTLYLSTKNEPSPWDIALALFDDPETRERFENDLEAELYAEWAD